MFMRNQGSIGGSEVTEATQRPWSRDKYGYMIANGENLYVAHGVTVPNGESHPRYSEALANEDLILTAVNSHDALVAALEAAIPMLTRATRTTNGMKRARLAAEAALEAARGRNV
jgi:hypothetical protein